ncbi:MAG: glycosyltransferase family 2 protein [Elusimicrobiota bacterium]
MQRKKHKLSVVIPVFNSEKTIGGLVDEIMRVLDDYNFEIVLVNDASKDNSHAVCVEKQIENPKIVRYFRLSRNFGEHNTVIAGLNQCIGDYAIIMDDDFQNPPEEIIKVYEYMLNNHYDVIYTRYEHKKHNWFRNFGSWMNDRMSVLLLKKPENLYLSSFKCVNRFIINEITKYRAPYTYIDGLILRVTANIGQMTVVHHERKEGKSNYTLWKLTSLWLNMFINFSVLPLRISFMIGALLTLFGVGMIIYFILLMLVFDPYGEWPAGWPSLIVCVITFSGAQLISLGLIGEYLGKMYLSYNSTPQFIIKEHLDAISDEIRLGGKQS